MADYKGVIIEESLEDKSILRELRIVGTEVEKITDRHKTPWLEKWTKHTEVPEDKAQAVPQRLANAIISERKGSWYSDFPKKRLRLAVFSL